MKKRVVIWASILIIAIFTGVEGVQSAEAENKTGFNGSYKCTFTTDQGETYNTWILLEDCKNGTVKASTDYNGFPVSITGQFTGNVDQGGAICNFAVNKPGLVKGQAEITIVLVDGMYQLSGQGSGSYSYQGTSGQISGKVLGSRKSSASISSNIPIRTAGLIAVIIVLIVILGYMASIYRKRADKPTDL
ncbi:MAG: hypothetical protein CVU90_03315 [Firmicutes bacterium HGW-Firmicutes-15]|nr:MAG: hypothetical protein CVU90_03315 [Firmicutes bacterium HGW-Firmicutes-15]